MAAVSANAKQLLRDQFSRETDVTRKLRALWTLYTIGGTDDAFLLPLLKSNDEHLRAWGIRLLSEHWPIDALHTRDEARPAPRGSGLNSGPHRSSVVRRSPSLQQSWPS